MRWAMFAAMILAAASTAGCGKHSSLGFRLPEDGDVARGKQAFVDLGCHVCHTVDRVELPEATEDVVVPIGGAVSEHRTDGYLVTSIIHPSHRIAWPKRDEFTTDGESRMPDGTSEMTVRQLIDLVAFLHSSYRFVPPPNVY